MNLPDKVYKSLEKPMTHFEIQKALDISKADLNKAIKELQERGVVYLFGFTSARRIMRIPDALDEINRMLYSIKNKVEKIEKKLGR